MSPLPRRKLSTHRPGTATPFFYDNPSPQWALSSDERAGRAGWRCRRDDDGLRWGAVGENRTRGWQCCSVCHFLESSGRAPLRDRARPVRPTLWMRIMLHCKRLHRSSEGAGSFILWILWMSGFGFWVKAERRCFCLFLHTVYFGRMETVGLIGLSCEALRSRNTYTSGKWLVAPLKPGGVPCK